MIRELIDATRAIRHFERALYQGTPLRDGREVRKIGRLVGYDPDKAERLIAGEVPFEPRDTFPMRAATWAKGLADG